MAADSKPPRWCDLCSVKPATMEVTMFYKMHKIPRDWTFKVCSLHSYAQSLNNSVVDYLGEWLLVDGRVWWWPVDSRGRPALRGLPCAP